MYFGTYFNCSQCFFSFHEILSLSFNNNTFFRFAFVFLFVFDIFSSFTRPETSLSRVLLIYLHQKHPLASVSYFVSQTICRFTNIYKARGFLKISTLVCYIVFSEIQANNKNLSRLLEDFLYWYQLTRTHIYTHTSTHNLTRIFYFYFYYYFSSFR